MQVVQADEQARLRTERVQREANLAKLEYQCQVLRGKWAEAVAAMRRRGAHADRRLAKHIERWAAVLQVLEERVAREAVELGLEPPVGQEA